MLNVVIEKSVPTEVNSGIDILFVMDMVPGIKLTVTVFRASNSNLVIRKSLGLKVPTVTSFFMFNKVIRVLPVVEKIPERVTNEGNDNSVTIGTFERTSPPHVTSVSMTIRSTLAALVIVMVPDVWSAGNTTAAPML